MPAQAERENTCADEGANPYINIIFERDTHPYMDKRIHHGRNVKRFRDMLGIKQEALASDLGEEWTQKKISLLENKEEIDRRLMEQIAGIMKVPVEALENFDEESVVNVISNSFTSNDTSTLNAVNIQCSINPLEKWMEALEENKRLYERLLQAEREKVELLQEMMKNK